MARKKKTQAVKDKTKEGEKKDGKEAEVHAEWGKSTARDYLYELLLQGKIPDSSEITAKEVFLQYCKDRPEFKDFNDYETNKFADRLRNTRARAEKRSCRAQVDEQALIHDRLIFSKPTEDTKGRPMWKGSDAQKQLRQDIADKLLEKDPETGKPLEGKYRPKELYEKREVYWANYDLDFIRNKIYEEIKFDKREAWVKAKMEAKKEKKRKGK